MTHKKQTLLIVEDQKTNIKILREMLKVDYTLLVVTSGENALEFIDAVQELPDLILLDIIMAGIDGYEVCKRLKQKERSNLIPVIFITSQSSEENEIRGFEVGAVDYITKPFSAPVVKARIKTHLELKELREHFVKMSTRDYLTGIRNRMDFDQTLEKEWKRMKRVNLPLSLIICDVDFFKKYNDQYGHLAGDACLQRVAAVIEANAKRPADVAARYGGEEFAVILPDTHFVGAFKIAEDIRLKMLEEEIPHAESLVSCFVSLSLGIATVFPSKERTLEQLINFADEALYKAKHNGRNRVEPQG